MTILLSVILFFPLNGYSQNIQSMMIGYSSNDLETSVAMGENNYPIYINGAIKLPEELVKDIIGCRITDIVFALEDTLTIQDNGVFISYDLNASPAYSESIEVLQKGWNDIELKSAFEITEARDIYIGFNYASKGYVVSFDGEKLNNNANFFAFSQIKQEIPSWYNETAGGCLNMYVIVEGSNLPDNKADIDVAYISKTIPSNNVAPVDIYVKNTGANVINDIEFTFTLNNETKTSLVDGLNIKSNEFKLVTVKDFISEKVGVSKLSVEISKVNGLDNTSNNGVWDFGNIICREYYKNKKNLMEIFSTQMCTACPKAEKDIKRIMKKFSNIIPVVHHCGFYEDSFTIEESKEYLMFYNGGTYTPAGMLNRTNFAKLGLGESNSPVFGISMDNMMKAVTEEVGTSSYVSLEINPLYNEGDNSVQVSITAKSDLVENIKGNNICLYVFLVEDGLTGVQQSAAAPIQNYVYNNTVRAVLTDVWGDKVEFDSNGYFKSEDYKYILDGSWKADNMKVVAFIGNSDSSQPNNCVVYNAESVKLNNDISFVEDVYKHDCGNIVVLNNTIYIEENAQIARLYTISGNLVNSFNNVDEINIDSLAEGFYILHLVVNNNERVFKIKK